MSTPLHLSGTLAKSLKLATDVDNLATGPRTAVLSFDGLACVEVVPSEFC